MITPRSAAGSGKSVLWFVLSQLVWGHETKIVSSVPRSLKTS